MSLRFKILLLSSLYFSQGLPFGFFTQALPVLLRKSGVSLEAIGLSSLLALPWALKFLWAPWVDRYDGSRLGPRRGWILPLQAAAILALGLLSLVDAERGLTWLLVAVFVTNLLAATQDIATDGLAVDILTKAERGLGNGVQVAGYRVGMIVGGGALLILFEKLGWAPTFLSAALLLALATLPVLRFRESPRAEPEGEEEEPRHGPLRGFFRSFREAARMPYFGSWMLVLLSYKLGDALGSGMVRPMLVDIGLTLEDIGWLMGGAGFTAGLLGALAGGWGTSRLGRRKALLLFGAIQVVAIGLYAVPALPYAGCRSLGVLYAVCPIEHFTGGMMTVALFTAMMDRCRRDEAATDYTIQASIVVLATGLGASLAGFVAGQVGYFWHFLIAAALSILGVALAWERTRPMQFS